MNTVVPHITSLIRSMTKLVLRFAHFANQFFLLKLIEIFLIHSKSQQPPTNCFFFFGSKQKMYMYKTNDNY